MPCVVICNILSPLEIDKQTMVILLHCRIDLICETRISTLEVF